jgi:hypothetical protein
VPSLVEVSSLNNSQLNRNNVLSKSAQKNFRKYSLWISKCNVLSQTLTRLSYQKNWPFTSENSYTKNKINCPKLLDLMFSRIWSTSLLESCSYLTCPALRMEAVNTSETPVNFYLAIRYHIPENNTFLFHVQNAKCDDNGVMYVEWLDGFWTDGRISWTPWYSVWLHFTLHYYTRARAHTHTHWCPQSRLH